MEEDDWDSVVQLHPSEEEEESDGGTEEDNSLTATQEDIEMMVKRVFVPAKEEKPKCKDGSLCKREDVEHWRHFSHPIQATEKADEPPSKRKNEGPSDATDGPSVKRSRKEERRRRREAEAAERQAFIEKCRESMPTHYQDAWDDMHVKLPCSPHNVFRSQRGTVHWNWQRICDVLKEPITTSQGLQQSVIAYSLDKWAHEWDYSGLHHFFEEVAQEDETQEFFEQVLPGIVKLALDLPQLADTRVPLLRVDEETQVVLSRRLCASLLANGFLSTMPGQDSRGHRFQLFDMRTLFGGGEFIGDDQVAKIRCLINYFKRVTSPDGPRGNISFKRLVLSEEEAPNWSESLKPLCKLHVREEGTIEETKGMLEVDFANKMIGGGVLSHGCVQEEIRFMLSPELIVSLLLTEKLSAQESLLSSLPVTGAEQYNKSKGYGRSFRFVSDFIDDTPVSGDFIQSEIVAMDALHFGRMRTRQYTEKNIVRELEKCYCAFQKTQDKKTTPSPIATGNWGCGVFGGYHDLKAIIQLLCASESERDMYYFTFGVQGLGPSLSEVYNMLSEKKVTVGKLYNTLEKVIKRKGVGWKRPQLFTHLFMQLDQESEQ